MELWGVFSWGYGFRFKTKEINVKILSGINSSSISIKKRYLFNSRLWGVIDKKKVI